MTKICQKDRHLCLEQISVPYNEASNKLCAKFSLGKDFAGRNLYIEAHFITRTHEYDWKYKDFKVSKNGHFAIRIPKYTLHIDLIIKIIISSNNTLVITGHFAQYENQITWAAYDGNGNNMKNPSWGMYKTQLLRKCPADYSANNELSIRGPTAAESPNPRHVSNVICSDSGQSPSSTKLSNMTWMWGQILDHELDLSPETGDEHADIITPATDQYPNFTIPFKRSIYDKNVAQDKPRQQVNNLSSFIDGSVIYGDDSIRAYALRKLDGSGFLKTSDADNGETLAGYNLDGLHNDNLPGQDPKTMFLLGDVRANENIFLTSIQTLFVREHNRLCQELVDKNPGMLNNDELIYQTARHWLVAFFQHITYYEFLPALLGEFPKYEGYKDHMNSAIANEFSGCIYRVGHTMLSSELPISLTETILLRDAFFIPSFIKEHGINNLLIGASNTYMRAIDNFIVDDIRNFLFGTPENGHLLDLATLNIQRGRDHGIPGYNKVRKGYGLVEKAAFTDITSNQELANKLASLYVSPDYIDPWIGMLCEDHLPGKEVGELIFTVLTDQFYRLREGDRFYYEYDTRFSASDIEIINKTKLSDIIKRNTGLDVRNDVFNI